MNYSRNEKVLVSIEKEMFTEIRKIYPNFNYHSEVYAQYWEYPQVDQLFCLLYQLFCESIDLKLNQYGWSFRKSIEPELGKEFHELEKKEEILFDEFFVLFDFFLKYRRYSKIFYNISFSKSISLLATGFEEK